MIAVVVTKIKKALAPCFVCFYCGIVFSELIAEGNCYTNNFRQGIGWHGDSERKLVVGVRLGSKMILKFAWFHRGLPASKSHEITLHHGDMYIMSSKAVG